jgi:hypothetical protein
MADLERCRRKQKANKKMKKARGWGEWRCDGKQMQEKQENKSKICTAGGGRGWYASKLIVGATSKETAIGT